MDNGNESAAELGGRAARKHLGQRQDGTNFSPSIPEAKGRLDLLAKARHLGIACRIVRELAESLAGDKAAGAEECLHAIRGEVSRTLTLAARSA